MEFALLTGLSYLSSVGEDVSRMYQMQRLDIPEWGFMEGDPPDSWIKGGVRGRVCVSWEQGRGSNHSIN